MKYIGGRPVYECKKQNCSKKRKKENDFCSFHMQLEDQSKAILEVFPV